MIEKIIDWSAKNRFLVIILYILLTAAGLYSLYNLNIDAIPDLSENQVIVYTEWMGRSAEIVENQLTFPLVSALQGLSDVKDIRGSSMFGMSFIFVIFEEDVDLKRARSQVLEKLSSIQSSLPQGAKPVLGPDGTGVGHILWYTLRSEKHDLAELRSLQDWFVKLRLSSVPGVAEVASIGGFVKQYQIILNPEKLSYFGIAPALVTDALRKSNSEAGGRILEMTDTEYYVRGKGYFTSLDDIANVVVTTLPGGRAVYVKDIADVSFGTELRRGLLDADGEGEVTGGIIVMQNGENAKEVIDRVKEKMEEIKPGLPEGVSIHIDYDRSELIVAAVSTLERALLEAAITVSLMVAIFLLHFRSIVRILIEIPVAVILSFILMYIFDITTNIMSLGGIIIAIGVIVDSSIVMVENAYRNIAAKIKEKGVLSDQDYKEISVNSAKQVGRAIFFSELMIFISFVPVFLLTGQEGKLFTPLAFTKSFVMLSSAVISISLIPVMMTFLMRGKFRAEQDNPVTGFFMKLYQPVIRFALRYRKTVLIINIVALLAAVPLYMSTGSEFMPSLDEGSLLFMPVTLPNISITETKRILTLQDKIIKSVPEVASVLGKAGRGETATDNAPLSMIETIIILKPHDQWRPGITKNDIINELDAKLRIPGVRNGWTQPIINRINMLSTGVRSDLGLKIYGTNPDTLDFYAVKAENLLKGVEGISQPFAERNLGGLYVDIKLKPEAARYGITSGELNYIIESLIGGEKISEVISGRERFPVSVRYSPASRDDIDALRDLLIPISVSGGNNVKSSGGSISSSSASMGGMSGMGGGTASAAAPAQPNTENESASLIESNSSAQWVSLSSIAEITIVPGASMINSENGFLRSIVYTNVLGRDLGSTVEDADEVISAGLKLPPGYTYEWGGQYENKMNAQKRLQYIIPLVLVIIFMLLYITLHDFKEAFVVMLSVPFALIGGIFMIYLLDYNFSVAVWVGFIALYGIAVETGVVMVVYLHEALDKRIRAARSEGREVTSSDIYEATVEGSVLRLRPKLMTVFTSMIGLIPIMWATGTGADVMKPLTAPMIGGLFTSAVHVLIVTPVIFIMMKEHLLKKGKLTISKMHNHESKEGSHA
ncbi:MAG: Cation efflux system protein CusA [Ignavibacteriaceae bacterium]|nr:Cation efflux system protein CusA [Ignavibacteriaceae bacterium]